MTTRRRLLGGTVAAFVGATGLAFGSGAFTQVEATRSLTVEVDADADGLLSIEENAALDSRALDVDDEGRFALDADGWNTAALISVGELDELGDPDGNGPEEILTEAFTVTNDGENAVDVSAGLDVTDGDSDVWVLLASEAGDYPDTFESIGDDEDGTIEDVDSGESIVGAFLFDTAGDETSAEVTFFAETVHT